MQHCGKLLHGKSFGDIYQFNKASNSRGASGNHWINITISVCQVHCDIGLECGGYKVADLDTSKEDDCPLEWTKCCSLYTI